jgi:hypothetical protein
MNCKENYFLIAGITIGIVLVLSVLILPTQNNLDSLDKRIRYLEKLRNI